MVCPGAVTADLLAEPLPPGGFTEEAFTAALVKGLGPDLAIEVHGWLMSEWAPWAREGWARAQVAQRFCLEQAAPKEKSGS